MRSFVVALVLTGCSANSSQDARLEALEAENEELRTDLTAATERITALESSEASTTGSLSALQTDVGAIQSRWLQGHVTWTIGQTGDYPTLQEAWTAALAVRLGPDSTLTLQLDAGTHTVDSGVSLNHPDGASIQIVGAGSATTTLAFPGGTGFSVTSGHQLGGLGYVTLDTDVQTGVGLDVEANSLVGLTDVVIQGFSYGLELRYGSEVAAYPLALHGNQIGAVVAEGSILDATELDASGNNGGIQAEWGAQVFVPALDVTDSGTYYGVSISNGSLLYADQMDSRGSSFGVDIEGGSVFSGQGGHYSGVGNGTCVKASGNSTLDIGYASLTTAGVGVTASDNATVDATGVTLSSVTTAYTNTFGAIIHHP